MAYGSPLDVGSPAAAAPPSPMAPGGEASPGFADQWRTYMANPDNRAALISFGASMLQPIAPGQSVLGHVGQSVAAAGSTLDERQKLEVAQQNANSQEDARRAAADLASERAANVSRNASLQEDVAAMKRGLGVQGATAQMYKIWEQQSSNPLSPDAIRNQTFEDFLKNNKTLFESLGGNIPNVGHGEAAGASAGGAPNVGDTRQYKGPDGTVHTVRFKGGNFRDRTNWEEVR